MKTTEQSYIEHICSHCKNKDKDLCEIRTRYDNTMYCCGYEKGNDLEGYKKPLQKTAKFEKPLMKGMAISNK